jgi:hypothetical protein
MNRKQRRKMEKAMGFLKSSKKMTASERKEMKKRKREAGKMIHQQNVEKAENDLREARDKREQEKIQGLIEKGFNEDLAIKLTRTRK